jgi:hypothetical protein
MSIRTTPRPTTDTALTVNIKYIDLNSNVLRYQKYFTFRLSCNTQ